MKKLSNSKYLILVFILITIAILASCVGKTSKVETPTSIKLEVKISYNKLLELLNQPNLNILLLDVRTAEEYSQGYIPGATLAPYDLLENSFVEPDKNRLIIVYCRSGRRSAIALQTLHNMGYTNVSDFGGISNWEGKLKF